MKNKIIMYIFLVLILLSVAFAVKPTVIVLDTGLTLTPVTYEYHPIDTPFFLHTNVYNTTSGVILPSNLTVCGYGLYSEKANWQRVDGGLLVEDDIGMSVLINESFFNTTGDHNILLWCEYPPVEPYQIGGFSNFYFTVYEDEKTPSNYFEIIGLIAVVLLLVVALVTGINIMGVITSIGIIIYGLTFMLSSILIGTLVLTGGLLLALYFATRQSE